MKKIMFSKFTTIIQQAVDALAPNLTLQEDFVYHWKGITNYFIDNKHEKKPIDHTNIPSHLDQMLQILQEEEEGCESGSTGPCMEYMLQHKLLETLYTLARTDFPPGMKQTVLVFFTKLLSRIKQPLLPHINVHKAVHRLVRVCGEVKAGPAENEEIHFLCTVCSKLAAAPYLVNFFLDATKRSTQTPQVSGEPKPPTPSKLEFSLINSLLALSQSADGRVGVKACEGLMLCCCLPEKSAAHRLIHHTNFCQSVTDRLSQLYKKLPKSLDPIDLECVQAKWGLDINTELGDSHSFPGKRTVISFLSWLDYCDQLISVAFPDVATALTSYIRKHFLEAVIQPAIMQPSETGAILATCYFCRCLRTVSSPLLLHEFVSFILGVASTPEPDSDGSCKLRQVLIDRCNHVSEELSIATLKLFDTLLQKEDSHIIHNLVLRNLLGRSYIKTDNTLPVKNTPVTESTETSDNDAAKTIDNDTKTIENNDTPAIENNDTPAIENGKNVTDNDTNAITNDTKTTENNEGETAVEPKQSSSAPDKADKEPVKSQTSVPSSVPSSPVKTEVHKIINSFLMLVPDELKSCSQTTDGDYDVYLRDAHRQYADISGVCRPWGWPSDPTSDLPYQTDSFKEGTFLHMILEKFTRLISQPYAVNLQVTSVLSRLCLIPHPNLHEFLLDPFLPVGEGVRTPYNILLKVIGEVKLQTVSELDIKSKLKTMRQELMGVETVLNSLRRQVSYKPSAEDVAILEGVIVIEEFCKELAAIAFVKHHASITS